MSKAKECFHRDGITAVNNEGLCKGCGLAVEHLAKTKSCVNADPCSRFGESLHDSIDRFRDDFDISYAEVIGMLEIVKQDLYVELSDSIGGEVPENLSLTCEELHKDCLVLARLAKSHEEPQFTNPIDVAEANVVMNKYLSI